MPRKAINKKPDGTVRYKNITVDEDIIALLNQRATELEFGFGFKPTISQTLRHIIKKEVS